MIVTLRLFARARDLAGTETVTLEVPEPATVALLRAKLGERYSALADLLPRCAFAVNGEFATDITILPPDAEVAVLPPVSGGQDDGYCC